MAKMGDQGDGKKSCRARRQPLTRRARIKQADSVDIHCEWTCKRACVCVRGCAHAHRSVRPCGRVCAHAHRGVRRERERWSKKNLSGSCHKKLKLIWRLSVRRRGKTSLVTLWYLVDFDLALLGCFWADSKAVHGRSGVRVGVRCESGEWEG